MLAAPILLDAVAELKLFARRRGGPPQIALKSGSWHVDTINSQHIAAVAYNRLSCLTLVCMPICLCVCKSVCLPIRLPARPPAVVPPLWPYSHVAPRFLMHSEENKRNKDGHHVGRELRPTEMDRVAPLQDGYLRQDMYVSLRNRCWCVSHCSTATRIRETCTAQLWRRCQRTRTTSLPRTRARDNVQCNCVA